MDTRACVSFYFGLEHDRNVNGEGSHFHTYEDSVGSAHTYNVPIHYDICSVKRHSYTARLRTITETGFNGKSTIILGGIPVYRYRKSYRYPYNRYLF